MNDIEHFESILAGNHDGKQLDCLDEPTCKLLIGRHGFAHCRYYCTRFANGKCMLDNYLVKQHTYGYKHSRHPQVWKAIIDLLKAPSPWRPNPDRMHEMRMVCRKDIEGYRENPSRRMSPGNHTPQWEVYITGRWRKVEELSGQPPRVLIDGKWEELLVT